MIFLPGFSTAKEVTNISGRGVGMDVVKTNIEKISGTIDLESEVGKGTIFKIRVPLTLAIIPALIVSSGGERFAIPQINLLELIRIDENNSSLSVENIQGCPVYRLRGKLLPLVYLNKELKLTSSDNGAANIVVLQAENGRFGLVVDQINDTQEIVVKPLADVLKTIRVFSGATIMGDGDVALILDTLGIGQKARVLSDRVENSVELSAVADGDEAVESESLVLVSSFDSGRFAIPLKKVSRLEQFPNSLVEGAGDSRVIQYRGQIMPLINISNFMGELPASSQPAVSEDDIVLVVVFGAEGHQIGLVVEEIIDVVEQRLTVRGKATRKGALATVSIDGVIAEYFDVSLFLESAQNPILSLGMAA